ncbi:MAG: MFS transporter, partial [Planctomycetota bacterium]
MRLLRSIGLFQGVERPGLVFAWGMYDLANQSFTLLINTILLPIYIKEVVVGVSTPAQAAQGDRLWTLMAASSLLLSVALSPFVGAFADAKGLRKRMLIGTGLGCVALTCAMGLLGPGDALLALALYIPANILYQLGENFMAAFLPVVSTRRSMGRVSAVGWTMGYVGALLLLLISYAAMRYGGLAPTRRWTWLLVFAGLWFLGGMLVPMRVLPEPPPDPTAQGRGVVKLAVARVRRTIRHARAHSQLLRFLTAFFVYGAAVQAVIFFAAIVLKDLAFAAGGAGNLRLIAFMAPLTVAAGLASWTTSKVQDRLGARTTVLFYLGVWIVGTALIAATAREGASPSTGAFLAAASLAGFGLGGIGAASRAVVGLFTPAQRTAEFFGLWGMT